MSLKRTVLIGDLHLESQIVLPMVEKKIDQLKIEQIIFLGDYVDAYGQTQNTRLYLNDLDFLFLWKKRMENRRIKVVNLIGNHDVPYLIFSPKSYSLVDEQGFRKVSLKLSRLNLQVAFQLGNYLVSHAGFIDGYSLKEWT